jgi:hypothetical protein
VLRSGEGVCLHLRDGSTFTVTVDDATDAVAALARTTTPTPV